MKKKKIVIKDPNPFKLMDSIRRKRLKHGEYAEDKTSRRPSNKDKG